MYSECSKCRMILRWLWVGTLFQHRAMAFHKVYSGSCVFCSGAAQWGRCSWEMCISIVWTQCAWEAPFFKWVIQWRLRKGASGRRSGRREKAGAHKLCPILFIPPMATFSNLETNCQRWIKYNSHDMKFALLKVYCSLVFSAFTKLCDRYHHTVAEHFHQRETPYPLAAIPFPTHCLAPLPSGCFMSVWICLLCMLHINKIIL